MLIEIRIIDKTGGGRDYVGHVQVDVGEVDGAEEVARKLVAAVAKVRGPACLDERDAADLRSQAVVWVKDRRGALNNGDLREAGFEFQLKWPARRPNEQESQEHKEEQEPKVSRLTPWKHKRK